VTEISASLILLPVHDLFRLAAGSRRGLESSSGVTALTRRNYPRAQMNAKVIGQAKIKL
jgi:hypothetical protein